ncbi:DUF4132 domain-containing protein [Massilia sp. CCM 8695]|uniref:DUF4132 domain-containing protein n=1 Tax=Massilia frigida TaxID=2609281 RepID=A0ABX0NEZ9_9BURK|nr:DUF4132 domain-containing protein [Massilia frigida]NHZ81349.1 DUF4132 domain-containing protein [Massilia frigida]
MRHFEFDDGTSRKFWSIEQDECELNVCFGKFGTTGQRQTKVHADADKAAAALAKLVKEKTAKGYVETAAGAPVAAQVPLPVPAAKAATPRVAPAEPIAPVTAAPASPGARTDIAPWLALDTLVVIPPKLAALALPSRRFPGKKPGNDLAKLWDKFCEAMTESFCYPEYDVASKAFKPAVNEAATRFHQDQWEGSLESDAILLAAEAKLPSYSKAARSTGSAFVDFLVARKGLAYALDVLLQMERWSCTVEHKSNGYYFSFTDADENAFNYTNNGIYTATELAYRAHLAHADQATWDQCLALCQAAVPGLPVKRRPLFGLLFSEQAGWCEQLILDYAATPDFTPAYWLQLGASSPETVRLMTYAPPSYRGAESGFTYPRLVATLLQERGLAAEALLVAYPENDLAAEGLACIGTPSSMRALAGASSTGKEAMARFTAAVQCWPLAGIAGLSEMIGAERKAMTAFAPMLATLLRSQADMLAALRPWLSDEANKVIDVLSAHIGERADLAGPADLPRVLAVAPWTVPGRRAPAPMELDLLDLAPVEQWAEGEREALLVPSDWDQTLSEKLGNLPGLIDWFRLGTKNTDRVARCLAKHDGADLAALWIELRDSRDECPYFSARGAMLMPQPTGLAFWNELACQGDYDIDFVLARSGVGAIPGMVLVCTFRALKNLHLALHLGAIELALPVARAFAELKTVRDTARQWLLAFPEHAACGLIAYALAAPGAERRCAVLALRLLAAEGHDALLMAVAKRYPDPAVALRVRALLDEDPLDRYPDKRIKAPDFWQPAGWTRPVLAASGKGLPDEALDHLGTMLRFPTIEGPYAGIVDVKAACTSDSLDAFAWDLFRAWMDAGAPAKEGWAFLALGMLGNDRSARKLTPLLRAWPGQSQHARAAAGLDILAAIGTDTALMLLNGIAQKLKFKALQDRARTKIEQIAEARNLSIEELEDRLAPDLGLDDSGKLALDFGPRRFTVGFDETLNPYVRDDSGARLKDLPKPKASDDQALAAEAVARFKLLKKDAKVIAAQQVFRLECAMCTPRHWTAEVFVAVLAQHPLLRHLVQRLVWGVYQQVAQERARLVACFRVTPEGFYTGAGDEDFVLPDGSDVRIGIPHALELPASDATAFGQLFADYELLQPFAQLGRDSYRAEADELDGCTLQRWEGKVVPTGRILGLVNRGWRRGSAEDHGCMYYFCKPIGTDKAAMLSFGPGIYTGNLTENPEQTLAFVQYGKANRDGFPSPTESLSTLDPVALSELIRDIAGLCA